MNSAEFSKKSIEFSKDSKRQANFNSLYRASDSQKQPADMVAYPIARFVIDPERANPAFERVE